MTQIFRTARSIALPLALAAGLFSLGGCAGAGEDVARSVGLMREAPDEFVVTTRAPLALPPDLNSLPTPTPGAARPQERSMRDAAQLTLAPQSVVSNGANTPVTTGEKALLKASGPQPAPGVRADVDRIANEDANSRRFGDQVMFWKDNPTPGTIVDAPLESQRIRQNAALGRSPVDGPTPIVGNASGGKPPPRSFDNSPSDARPAPVDTSPQTSKHWWDIF